MLYNIFENDLQIDKNGFLEPPKTSKINFQMFSKIFNIFIFIFVEETIHRGWVLNLWYCTHLDMMMCLLSHCVKT